MEQGGFGNDSIPTSSSYIDKSRVLDVKPLRRLVPVFPSYSPFPPTQTPGSFPFSSGIPPFNPFFQTPGTQNGAELNHQTSGQNRHFGFNTPISDAVPLNSFRSEEAAAAMNGGSGLSGSEEAGKARKRGKYKQRKYESNNLNATSSEVNVESIIDGILASSVQMTFDSFRQADGDKEFVKHVHMIYDLFRRKLTQIDEAKEVVHGASRRPDLRAGTIMMNKGIRTNVNKRIGSVAGVEVGDIFFFRMELCVIGLHAPIMAGIGYMGLKVGLSEEPVAISIVSSGGYEDNDEGDDVLIYSGQGGNIYRKDKDITDQKLERGNLALEKSLHHGNEIRVIRGIKDEAYPTGKVYIYDGLYKIHESRLEKGKSGYNVFKYKLVRLPNQPKAFAIWKLIQQWGNNSISRDGVILPDLTSGVEKLPVSLINDVDNEKGPAHFTYITNLKYPRPVNPIEPLTGCGCTNGCRSNNFNCPCVQKNGGYIPYITNSMLVEPKPLITECGPSCQCPPTCRNRLSQGELRLRLEVFKTNDKGWGLRSLHPIRAGAFICEYAGEVIDKSDVDRHRPRDDNQDPFIFDTTRYYQPLEVLPGDNNVPKVPFPLVICARNEGNVARFMNHSCSPNVFWQPVLRANSTVCDLHVAFFAIKHIPPMAELSYDYGVVQPEKSDLGRKVCLCGATKCRGSFN